VLFVTYPDAGFKPSRLAEDSIATSAAIPAAVEP
jgi:hypothetical protein